MDMVNKFGKMVLSMMDNGKETKQMVMELLFMLMEIFMRVNGSMIKLMDMEHINMPMELLT
jgi:hypothetical protein